MFLHIKENALEMLLCTIYERIQEILKEVVQSVMRAQVPVATYAGCFI
jgi:hypothetical protein